MNDNVILIIAILISGGIGAYLGMLFTKLKSKSEQSTLEERQNQMHQTIDELKQNLSKIENEREAIRNEKDFLNAELTRRNTEFENLQQLNIKRDAEIEERQTQLRKDFELLATKILDEKTEKFTLQNKENIKNILNPLQEKIKTFEEKVDLTQKESISMHSALKEQLLGLKDLNQQMTKEATNLTRALKGDSQIQGNWGEIILTRVLEKSGLNEGREYSLQDSHIDDEGKRLRTDVLIHLPDGKKIVVDSKVSLTDFERFVSSDDDNEKQIHLKNHINSIKRHVDQLSTKKYHYLYDAGPDTVFMFIPIEPAFALASSNEPKLYEEAFGKHVIIVTPSTLLAALKLIENLWQNDRQKQNALEIATQAGKLYDQFVNLTNDLLKVGNQLNTVKGSYDSTMKKLTGRGNLLSKVENIKKLGIKANKQVNEKLLKIADENSEDDDL
ncbi:DNA recombination protein RmuC [Hwangdonia lutea]|uniref:DNA recombination protein RmuC n=1 Tax=Hwangdonia lutea TaxID=3075823 RepID=A0AA97EMJ7_9FLAO|nr:DNA recombination protein RmuC [Hwangdonia sp. SCSIO 19198]WOD44274.1 DNA recombination protein RmuC [Hwangdonia sp. SCSIO 19198]